MKSAVKNTFKSMQKEKIKLINSFSEKASKSDLFKYMLPFDSRSSRVVSIILGLTLVLIFVFVLTQTLRRQSCLDMSFSLCHNHSSYLQHLTSNKSKHKNNITKSKKENTELVHGGMINENIDVTVESSQTFYKSTENKIIKWKDYSEVKSYKQQNQNQQGPSNKYEILKQEKLFWNNITSMKTKINDISNTNFINSNFIKKEKNINEEYQSRKMAYKNRRFKRSSDDEEEGSGGESGSCCGYQELLKRSRIEGIKTDILNQLRMQEPPHIPVIDESFVQTIKETSAEITTLNSNELISDDEASFEDDMSLKADDDHAAINRAFFFCDGLLLSLFCPCFEPPHLSIMINNFMILCLFILSCVQ